MPSGGPKQHTVDEDISGPIESDNTRAVRDYAYADQYSAVSSKAGEKDKYYNARNREYFKSMILKRKNGSRDVENIEKPIDEKNTYRFSDRGYK